MSLKGPSAEFTAVPEKPASSSARPQDNERLPLGPGRSNMVTLNNERC